MKITKDDVIINVGYMFEILFFLSAGVSFANNNILIYLVFGLGGIITGTIVSHAIKQRERNRIKNATTH